MKVKDLKKEIQAYKNQEFDIPDIYEKIEDEAKNAALARSKPKRHFTFKVRYAISFAVVVIAVAIAIPIISSGTKKSFAPAMDSSPLPSKSNTEGESYYEDPDSINQPANEPQSEAVPKEGQIDAETEAPDPSSIKDLNFTSLDALNEYAGCSIKASNLSVTDEKYVYESDTKVARHYFTYNGNSYYVSSTSISNVTKDLSEEDTIHNTSNYEIYWIIDDIYYSLQTISQATKEEFTDVYNSVR